MSLFPRLKTEIEVVHKKLRTDVKTFAEEVLSDIQKKHDLWEQKVSVITFSKNFESFSGRERTPSSIFTSSTRRLN